MHMTCKAHVHSKASALLFKEDGVVLRVSLGESLTEQWHRKAAEAPACAVLFHGRLAWHGGLVTPAMGL